MYSECYLAVTKVIGKSKSRILHKKISECNGDQKKTLCWERTNITLPKYDSPPLTLASGMNTFFIDKIDSIRAVFTQLKSSF